MRIRTIKPDFWLHEGLAELSPLHRLLFIGLWQLADRAGRLEDRPKRIAAALFPYAPKTPVDALLADLDVAGHVHRYEGFIAIPGFPEHQRPHPKEAASTIPDPPSREKKRLAVEGLETIPSSPVGREGKGTDNGKGREGVPETGPRPEELAGVWNDYRPTECPTVKADELSDGRKSAARARLRERPDLQFWTGTCVRLRDSDFCRGLRPGSTWTATFDWLLRPDTATKINEGSYDGKKSAGFDNGFDPNGGILRHA